MPTRILQKLYPRLRYIQDKDILISVLPVRVVSHSHEPSKIVLPKPPRINPEAIPKDTQLLRNIKWPLSETVSKVELRGDYQDRLKLAKDMWHVQTRVLPWL